MQDRRWLEDIIKDTSNIFEDIFLKTFFLNFLNYKYLYVMILNREYSMHL